MALSPGGRSLAAFSTDPALRAIRIHDLLSDTAAGELLLSEETRSAEVVCNALAFSPDGRELAGLFEFNRISQLLCWNVADGEQVVQIDFGAPVRAILNATVAYLHHPLDWFPDRGRWLVYGQGVVDRDAGRLIWIIPEAAALVPRGIRRVIDQDRVLAVFKREGGNVLGILPLPLADLQQVADVAKLGTLPVSPLSAADWSRALEIAAPGRIPAWQVVPEPIPPARADPLPEPIRLRPSSGPPEALLVALAGPAGGTAVVAHGTDIATVAAGIHLTEPLPADTLSRLLPRVTALETYDLAGRRHQSTRRIPGAAGLLALSRDGTHALTRDEAGNRVDLWSLNEGRHVVGWMPHAADNPWQSRIELAGIVDPAHVVTLSQAHKLVLWELPYCRAVYKMEPALRPVLSPNRMYLAVAYNHVYRFHDTLTGGCLGALPAPEPPAAAAFHPNGSRFAAVFAVMEGQRLVCWDLASGRVETEFPLPRSGETLQ
jgi:hypothetical protein